MWREPLRVNRRGIMSELLFFWMILFSLVGGGCSQSGQLDGNICFSGSSRIPLEVLLDTRSLMLCNGVAPTSAQNQTIIYNWPKIPKPPPDLVNPWRLPVLFTWAQTPDALFPGCVQIPKQKPRNSVFESTEAQDTFQNFKMFYWLSSVMSIWQIQTWY